MTTALRHLSVRVPWHDNGWNGTICRRPSENGECLILPNIRDRRVDLAEEALAGRRWEEITESQLPPCVRERAGFMAPFEQTVHVEHPYAEFSRAHRELAPTPLRLPPFAAPCVPFRWMRQKEALELAPANGVDYDPELEERAREDYNVPGGWVQHGDNQRALLNGFFAPIEQERSLCFFYAKRVPLSDDERRVLVGVGRVRRIADAVPYRNAGASPITPYVWEKVVEHSIRPTVEDGFVLPYQEVLAAADADEELGVDELVAFAPDEHWVAFSYGSEHVSHDAAIGALLSCAAAFERIEQRLVGPRARELAWISERLGELWKLRGPTPGLGAALQAFGLDRGVLIVHELAPLLEENSDPWPIVEQMFDNPNSLKSGLHRLVTSNWRRKWKSLDHQRRELLKLLSRFDLTVDQARRFWDQDARSDGLTDEFLISNPYLLYERDRVALDPIALTTVDHGAFPSPVVAEKHPLPEPAAMDDELDPRRVRAVTMAALEDAASDGNTVAPRADVIRRVDEMHLEPRCPVDADLYKAFAPDLAPNVVALELGDGRPAFQLDRFRDVGDIISHRILRRLKGAPHRVDVDWRFRLDAFLGVEIDPDEKLARDEKAAALEVLGRSRFSVLVGAAGTGKTTLLQLLSAEPEIRDRGVLLLAPTGKARVQLARRIPGATAKTIAQFLHPNRYDGSTGRYFCTGGEKEDAYATVIIDESSMLTEEMLAAVLDAIGGVHRLILAGDPRQLPPIGPGRPFVDIVRELEPPAIERAFPRCTDHYAELTVTRRQGATGIPAGERSDLLLAEWFAGRRPGPGGDDVWNLVRDGEADPTLRIVSWTDTPDLQGKLTTLLAEELSEMSGPDDVEGFERSLGGTLFENGKVYFRLGEDGAAGAGAQADDWQILSPVRNHGYGVRDLNRFMQLAYRVARREDAEGPYRHVPKPIGDQGIVYGDKVMNVINGSRRTRPRGLEDNYVANGEIGMAIGQYLRNDRPQELQVEFSSQTGRAYRYWSADFSEASSDPLELAYAITVHKAQGSEFGLTFLVIPSRTRLLSRELLYTALTRQRDRVVLLIQDGAELFDLTHAGQSVIARRLTTLFRLPTQVEHGGAFLEEGLIHRTRRGDLVRSKSEVIIADLLFDRKLEYSYEPEFVGRDGQVRRPDYRVDDPETGATVYWEHLGMLHQAAYARRWQRKLAWYREQGVVPYGEGVGPAGTLVITEDDEHGGIDSARLSELVGDLFGV